MTVSTTQYLSKAAVKEEAAESAATVASFNLPQVGGAALQAVLSDISERAADGHLEEAIRELAPQIYADPTDAERAVRVGSATIKALEEDAKRMRLVATKILRVARKADPSVAALTVGRWAEGVEGTPSAAFKQRWSRFALAIDLVDRSAAAAKAGKREHGVSLEAAMFAAYNATEKRDELRAMASEGQDLPKDGRRVGNRTSDDGAQAARVTKGSDVVKAAQRLLDVSKHADLATLSEENRKEIARCIREAVAALSKREVSAVPEAPIV